MADEYLVALDDDVAADFDVDLLSMVSNNSFSFIAVVLRPLHVIVVDLDSLAAVAAELALGLFNVDEHPAGLD